VLPIPLLAGFLFAYLIYVFYPVTHSASLARSALEAAQAFRVQERKGFPSASAGRVFLWEKVVKPLDGAAREDSTDAHRQTQRGFWFAELWRLTVVVPTRAEQERAATYGEKAVQAVQEAELLDPNGKEAYLIRAEIYRRFAARKPKEADRKQLYWLASEALRRLADVDPSNARVRYDLAAMLAAAGKADKAAEEAREALRLAALAPPQRGLSPPQQRQAEAWIRAARTRP
jgi:tetratricopeptide (TPR) repeat protein